MKNQICRILVMSTWKSSHNFLNAPATTAEYITQPSFVLAKTLSIVKHYH